MYCDRCGSSLAPTARFCGTCGKALYPTSAPAMPGTPAAPSMVTAGYDGRVRRHVQALALLWCINGILRLLEVFSFYVIGRTFWPWLGHMFLSRVPFGFGAFPVFSWLWALPFLAFFGVVHLFLAWSLYERKPWARALGLVVAFLALVRFPLGTALGVYTIWVLLPESSGREYDRMAQAAA